MRLHLGDSCLLCDGHGQLLQCREGMPTLAQPCESRLTFWIELASSLSKELGVEAQCLPSASGHRQHGLPASNNSGRAHIRPSSYRWKHSSSTATSYSLWVSKSAVLIQEYSGNDQTSQPRTLSSLVQSAGLGLWEWGEAAGQRAGCMVVMEVLVCEGAAVPRAVRTSCSCVYNTSQAGPQQSHHLRQAPG
jgi:hypothetical protein